MDQRQWNERSIYDHQRAIYTSCHLIESTALEFLKRVGYSDINTLAKDDSEFFYEAGMTIDAYDACHAYYLNRKLGLDFLIG